MKSRKLLLVPVAWCASAAVAVMAVSFVGAKEEASKDAHSKDAAKEVSKDTSKEHAKDSADSKHASDKSDKNEHESDSAQASTPPPISAIRERDTTGCLVDPVAIEDVKKRREELDTRGKELEARNVDLAARERALNEEIKKLALIREEIAGLEAVKKKENEEKVSKVVETIESMSPKAAANLVASIDESLAVSAMFQVSTAKLAKIMNLMEPGRSTRLTELLAGVARARQGKAPASRGAAVATQGNLQLGTAQSQSQSAKGGERENGHNNSQSNSVSENKSSEQQQQPEQREPASSSGNSGAKGLKKEPS